MKHEMQFKRTADRQDLEYCRFCGLERGGLTTDCPAQAVDIVRRNAVVRRDIDYIQGRWQKPLDNSK